MLGKSVKIGNKKGLRWCKGRGKRIILKMCCLGVG